MSKIKLEVGKTYRNRKGEEVKVVRKDDNSRFRYQGSRGGWYTESGRWRYFGKEHPEDLVEEVTMPSTSQKYDKMTVPKLEVGKIYRIDGFEPTRHTFTIPDGVKEITLDYFGNRLVVEMVPEEEPKPVVLKEGDVVFEDGRIMIVKMYPNSYHAMFYPNYGKLFINGSYGIPFTSATFRPATPEEAQPLFDALKKAGKRWNSETMQVEEIPEFDRILEWAETNTEYGYYNQEDVAEAIEGYLKYREGKK